METRLADFIWGIADQLRGVYKPAQYGTVMLPFLILRRMECVLREHRETIATARASAPNEQALAARLRRRGLHYYNTSPHTLTALLGAPGDLADNLLDYVSAFSASVADIFERFGFAKTISKLEEKDRLFLLVDEFADLDLHPDRLDNSEMGKLFEHLIYKFSTASNETAGEFYTPRDAIELMVVILLAPDNDVLGGGSVVRRIYDPTAGTGGMLSVADEAIREMNPSAQVTLSGQELNDESYAICKADMVAKGQAVDAIRLGDTLKNDLFAGQTFDYCLSNPPYGGDWKASEQAVRAEAKRSGGRFHAGLPRISDGQMLFLQHIVSKMQPATSNEENSGGRAAIVLNGSPLFSGGASSGESEIRRWLLESDLVDAIIALPTNMFYNTGIATYAWFLDNNKPKHRRGQVQLVDARERWSKLRKNLGSKNREISEDDREAVARVYRNFADSDESKILTAADFGYHEITVEQPLQLRFEITDETLTAVRETKQFDAMAEESQQSVATALDKLRGQVWIDRDPFLAELRKATKEAGYPLSAAQVKAIWQAVGVHDEEAKIIRDRKGEPEPDPALRDTEIVPFERDIEEYFETEVLPYIPLAWIDHSKTKVGYEIPFTRLFYTYVPPRPLEEIDAELDQLAAEIVQLLHKVEA